MVSTYIAVLENVVTPAVRAFMHVLGPQQQQQETAPTADGQTAVNLAVGALTAATALIQLWISWAKEWPWSDASFGKEATMLLIPSLPATSSLLLALLDSVQLASNSSRSSADSDRQLLQETVQEVAAQLCPAMSLLGTVAFYRSYHFGEQAPAKLVRTMALGDAHVVMALNVAMYAHMLSTHTRGCPQLLAASSSGGKASASQPHSTRRQQQQQVVVVPRYGSKLLQAAGMSAVPITDGRRFDLATLQQVCATQLDCLQVLLRTLLEDEAQQAVQATTATTMSSSATAMGMAAAAATAAARGSAWRSCMSCCPWSLLRLWCWQQSPMSCVWACSA